MGNSYPDWLKDSRPKMKKNNNPIWGKNLNFQDPIWKNFWTLDKNQEMGKWEIYE